MNRAALIPPITNEDLLPHDKAVWRDYAPCGGTSNSSPGFVAGKRVSIDYGSDEIVQDYGHLARWDGARRWRFGWAPN